MTSDTDLVELTTARSPLEAEWLVGALKGHSIRAVVFGDDLADEFAMSQKLMGLGGGVRVMVPRPTLEAARAALEQIDRDRPSDEALEEAYAAAPALESDDGSPPAASASSPGKTAAIVLLTAAVIALGWLALKQQDTISWWETDGTVFTREWRGDRFEYRWRDSGALAFVAFDRDEDGDFEETRDYDRTGRLVRQSLDENRNGIYEVTFGIDADRERVLTTFDKNENGIPERFEYAPRDGVLERWTDADEDWHAERLEFLDAKSGEILDAFEYRGREGYVRVR